LIERGIVPVRTARDNHNPTVKAPQSTKLAQSVSFLLDNEATGHEPDATQSGMEKLKTSEGLP
jgi:hypothetical protein